MTYLPRVILHIEKPFRGFRATPPNQVEIYTSRVIMKQRSERNGLKKSDFVVLDIYAYVNPT